MEFLPLSQSFHVRVAAEAVRKREDGTLEITPEDIMGKQRQE